MKKGKKVHSLQKPVSQRVRSVVIIGGALLLVGIICLTSLAYLSQQSTSTWHRTLPNPTPTSILTQSPNDPAPELLSTDTWQEYRNLKYGYSIKLPPEFKPFQAGVDPNTALSHLSDSDSNVFVKEVALDASKPQKNSFTVKIGYLIHVDVNNTSFACATDEDCYNEIYQHMPMPIISDIHFPLYATVAGRQVKGLGLFYNSVNHYTFTYPLSVNGKYFAVEFRLPPYSTDQIKEQIPLIDSILSTVAVGN